MTSTTPRWLLCPERPDEAGVGRMTAWRWLKALQFYGFLELIHKGTKADGKASEWRCLPVLDDGEGRR